MTSDQFERCWTKMGQLWPNWKRNDALREAWSQVLFPWPFDTGRLAIERHWQDNGNGFCPDPKSVKKLLRSLKDQSIHPKQAGLLVRWPKLTKLDQCRYARDSFAAQAMKCQDDAERERLQSKSDLYAAHAARLYRMHANDCPPRYGDRTLMPGPWSTDLPKFESQKKEPEVIDFVEVTSEIYAPEIAK